MPFAAAERRNTRPARTSPVCSGRRFLVCGIGIAGFFQRNGAEGFLHAADVVQIAIISHDSAAAVKDNTRAVVQIQGEPTIAAEFLKSKDDPDRLHNFTNSWLAEPWEDTKLKTSAELVQERQTERPAYEVPPWAKLLTGGVDVQENCLYWSIRAWGDFLTSQNIAHGQAFSFNEIANYMNLEYRQPDGTAMMVALCLIDSGDQTDEVYEFCAENAEWALPCKGTDTMLSHYKCLTPTFCAWQP